ncbi:hypothetical protein COF37_07710 [Bacillus wiedmannii]|nr:hypothetical protein CN599_14750 [Bacillus wiedmannii]PHA36003.1 hypothetical protein COE69_03895 [Bacillus wiedmannii]PHD26204.1 hypothetical protein COF37_07710 [Bacillus wiedmannii]
MVHKLVFGVVPLIYIWIPMRMHLNHSSLNNLLIFLIVNAYRYLINGYLKFFHYKRSMHRKWKILYVKL